MNKFGVEVPHNLIQMIRALVVPVLKWGSLRETGVHSRLGKRWHNCLSRIAQTRGRGSI